jgi:transposase
MPDDASLRRQMARELGANRLPVDGHTDQEVLASLLDSGYSVVQLHRAFGVSKKTIYTWLDRHDLEAPRPPTRGPAAILWNADTDTVGDPH